MHETSSSPIRLDQAHEGLLSRRALISSEARRLSRRRSIVLAVAARCRKIAADAINPTAAQTISARAMRRAAILHVRFHRALDALMEVGGFDEALAIVKERGPSGRE
jgi:hypothetical protein